MAKESDEIGRTESTDRLRAYSLRVIRYLSATALDPHRYFEQKYTGDVSIAETRSELTRILITLIEWHIETVPGEADRDAIDRSLCAEGFPSLSMLCRVGTRPAGLILVNGRVESAEDARLVGDFLRTAPADDADRPFAERLLKEDAHE